MGGPVWIWKVRVLNRRDCCGGRLSGTKVMIDNQECGQIQNGTKNGQWYEVKCSKPLRGTTLKLITTRNDYLSISGIQAYTAMVRMMRTTSISRSRTGPPMMKMGGFGGHFRRAVPFKMSFSMGNAKVTLN
jgi:hypothetical protein